MRPVPFGCYFPSIFGCDAFRDDQNSKQWNKFSETELQFLSKGACGFGCKSWLILKHLFRYCFMFFVPFVCIFCLFFCLVLFVCFFNLHLVFLPPPLSSPPKQRIERDFNVLLLFILWMFSSGSTCASGRKDMFSKWRFIVGHADLWRALMYQTCHLSFSLNIFLLSLCSRTAVHMSNTVSFCLIHYKLCH